MHPNLTGKIHDVIASLTAGGVVAVALSDLDVALKVVIGFLTSVFLLLGIVIRARELRSQKRRDRSDDDDG